MSAWQLKLFDSYKGEHTFLLIVLYCITGIEKQTVKLIKWYNTIVHEIDIDKPGSLENLFSKELISQQDNTVVTSENTSQQEKIRRLLEEIIRKNASSSYTAFLEFLKEDICYMEYATKIEETDISDFDLELLCIGELFNNFLIVALAMRYIYIKIINKIDFLFDR